MSSRLRDLGCVITCPSGVQRGWDAENVGVENAGVENAGADRRGGKCRSENRGAITRRNPSEEIP